MRLNIFNVPQKKESHTGFERHEFFLFLKLQFTQTFSHNVLKKSTRKDNILKNAGNQTVNGTFFHTMEVNGYRQLFGNHHS